MTQTIAETDLPRLPPGWTFTIETPWSPEDEIWLEVCLEMARHFDLVRGYQVNRPGNRADWKLLREEAGFSLKELGLLIGVDAATVSRYESGARTPSSAAYFAWLSEAAESLADEVMLRVADCQALRDGWILHDPLRLVDIEIARASSDPEATLYEIRTGRWDALFRSGGSFDRWCEVGQLPAWTPRDAGIPTPLVSPNSKATPDRIRPHP